MLGSLFCMIQILWLNLHHYPIKHNIMKSVHSEKAPAAVGPYSQAIEANGFVFASGQLPIKDQTRQSILNAQAVLKAAGLDLSKVIKTTVYLSDMANFGAMNEVYAEYFAEPYPARSAVAVRTLPKEALVEVECIAVKA